MTLSPPAGDRPPTWLFALLRLWILRPVKVPPRAPFDNVWFRAAGPVRHDRTPARGGIALVERARGRDVVRRRPGEHGAARVEEQPPRGGDAQRGRNRAGRKRAQAECLDQCLDSPIRATESKAR